MCGQCYAYNRYATLPDSNSLSMGFSGYQNVNSSSQRDNSTEYQKNIKTLGNPVFSRVFFMSAFGKRKYINIEIKCTL